MKKSEFSQGDLANWSFENQSFTVVLLERWDRKPKQRVAWLVRKSDEPSSKPFAVPEIELSKII